MYTLPFELRLQICNYLDFTSLKSVRLTSRECDQAAVKVLFKELWVTYSSIGRLFDPSFHEILNLHVRSIVFFIDLLPSILPEIWHERSYSCIPSVDVKSIGLNYGNYSSQYRQQQHFFEESRRKQHDPVVNRWPSKLHRIKIIGPTWCYLGDSTASPCCVKNWCKVWRDLDKLGLCPVMMPEDLSCYYNSVDIFRFLSLPAKSFVTKFGWELVPWRVWDLLFTSEPEFLAFITHIQTLDLGLFKGLRYSSSTDPYEIERLSDCLSKGQALEKLHLCISNHFQRASSPIRRDFLRIFRPTMPRLKQTEVSGITTTLTSVVYYLAQYRETLTSASFKDILLIVENKECPKLWSSAIRYLDVGSWKLRDLVFEDFSYATHGSVAFEALESKDLKSLEIAVLSCGHSQPLTSNDSDSL